MTVVSKTESRAPIPKLKRSFLVIWLPALAIIIALILHRYWPNRQLVLTTADYTRFLLGFLLFYFSWALGSCFYLSWRRRLSGHAPLAVAGIMLLALAELITLKLNWLPLPFFPSPDKILEAFTKDTSVLVISVLFSLRLLGLGYLTGVLLGLPTGIMMGWYAKFRYWVNPVVKILGPIPATAWIPIALAVFPTSFSASVYLIAVCTWFPVTVMTWSGIANVNKSYFEIARTLGAGEKYLIWQVALPAAMPMIFIGLFMGLGASFVTLIVAEMLGVKAGLGWYIQWAQGWGEYYKVYAALIISAVLFSSLITFLFKVRDRVLGWQRGLLKW